MSLFLPDYDEAKRLIQIDYKKQWSDPISELRGQRENQVIYTLLSAFCYANLIKKGKIKESDNYFYT